MYVLVPLTVLVCVMLILVGRYKETVLISASFITTIALAHALKLLFQRPRPTPVEILVNMPSDWSFPSAHAAQATVFFISLSFIALRIFPSLLAAIVTFLSILIIGCVGYSRVYLHVHHVSDVLAGIALAILIVAAVYVIIRQ